MRLQKSRASPFAKVTLLAAVASVGLAAPARGEALPSLNNVIFLHHSIGANLIAEGNVRALLAGMGYEFWDHGYNSDGLTGPDGNPTGIDYGVPGDNTNPDGFAAIFSQTPDPNPPAPNPPANTFSGLLRHEVIAFKSCFPASDIYDDGTLDEYKEWYRTVRAAADLHPDKLFIAFSTPPRTPLDTDGGQARRARAFANWLKSPEYLSGHPNLFSFDFFSLLAQSNRAAADRNTLRSRYRPADTHDSHPNALANASIGPVFARFVDNAEQVYNGSCPATPPEAPILESPADGFISPTRRVSLDWSDASCAVWYEIRVRRDRPAGPLVAGEITAESRYRTPRLARGHAYFWRAAACNNWGCSPWMPFRRFTIIP